MSAGCIGCRRDSHNSAAWSSNFPRHLYVRVPVPSNACLFLEVGEMSAYMSDASLNANVCRKSRVRRRRRSLPFTTAPRPYIDRADFLMATNCLSYIFCPIPPLSLSVWKTRHLNLSMPFYILKEMGATAWEVTCTTAWQKKTMVRHIWLCWYP